MVGAGASPLSFVDTLLSDSAYRPGGHWNHAYPFVRLHQPSAHYGVSSRELSNWTKDKTGPNQGLYGLALAAEVLAHFEQVLHFISAERQQVYGNPRPYSQNSPFVGSLAKSFASWHKNTGTPERSSCFVRRRVSVIALALQSHGIGTIAS